MFCVYFLSYRLDQLENLFSVWVILTASSFKYYCTVLRPIVNHSISLISRCLSVQHVKDSKSSSVTPSLSPLFSILIESWTPHFSDVLLSFSHFLLCLWSSEWPCASSTITLSISSPSFCPQPLLLLSTVPLCLPCSTLHPFWWATCFPPCICMSVHSLAGEMVQSWGSLSSTQGGKIESDIYSWRAIYYITQL